MSSAEKSQKGKQRRIVKNVAAASEIETEIPFCLMRTGTVVLYFRHRAAREYGKSEVLELGGKA